MPSSTTARRPRALRTTQSHGTSAQARRVHGTSALRAERHRRMRSGTRRTSRHRLILLPLLALFAATWTGPTSANVAVGSRVVKRTQELVALRGAHEAFARPSGKAARLGRVQARRPL